VDTVHTTLLMPIRNGEMYLDKALANLEANVRLGDDVLLIDDNSDDRTYDLLEEWCSSRPAFQVLKNPGRGLVEALNFGLNEARGEWIARFDVDDNYRSERVSRQIEVINHNTVAVFSDYTFMSEDGIYLGRILSAVSPFATELSVLSSQRLPHPVALLKKSAVLRAGGYRQSEFPAEDLGLWLRLMEFGTFESVPEQLLNYTISRNSISGSKRVLMEEARDKLLANPTQVRRAIKELNPTLRRIFGLYKGRNFYWERTLFHIRDLQIAAQKGLLTKKQSNSLKVAIVISGLNPMTLISIMKHYRYKQLRNNLRT